MIPRLKGFDETMLSWLMVEVEGINQKDIAVEADLTPISSFYTNIVKGLRETPFRIDKRGVSCTKP